MVIEIQCSLLREVEIHTSHTATSEKQSVDTVTDYCKNNGGAKFQVIYRYKILRVST